MFFQSTKVKLIDFRGQYRIELGLALCVGSMLLGCETKSSQLPPATNLPPRETIIAQGQILPVEGIVQLAAAPGDVVAKKLTRVGDQVTQGQALLEMRSQSLAQARLKTLTARRDDAQRERNNSLATAARQLAATELKLEHLQSQKSSLGRKAELLKAAQEQVADSERILKKLEAISANPTTSEFVGQLEIDRQRLSIKQSQINYQQQAEAHRQAEEELAWAIQAAKTERDVARDALAAVQASQALEVLDLEIAAAKEQDAAARVISPINGVVVAINASEGESSLPFPLIELANLDQMVVEVEINELDAASVQIGQTATITARALGKSELKGQVARKFNLVGRPQLRSPDPLARVDYRTVTAMLELDEVSSKAAQGWLQLHVEAEIDLRSPISSNTPAE